jgi:hypothetical protein
VKRLAASANVPPARVDRALGPVRGGPEELLETLRTLEITRRSL